MNDDRTIISTQKYTSIKMYRYYFLKLIKGVASPIFSEMF